VGGGDPIERRPIEGSDAIEPVARGDRHERLDPSALRAHKRGESQGRRVVEAEHAAQERAPRKPHGDGVGDAAQLRRRRLGGASDEQHIRQPALAGRPGGTPGCLGHRGRVGVEADDESPGIGRGGTKDAPAVAGPEVDDHPLVAGDQVGELADVHLVDAPADDGTHDEQSTATPPRYSRMRLAVRPGAPADPPTLRLVPDILPYVPEPPAVRPWDPRAPHVARTVANLIGRVRPDLRPEHVGSTAVPDLPGKGVVDLAIPAPPDDIPAISEALLEIGFGRQGGTSPWPSSRPMLVGAIDDEGDRFRIHAHVIPATSNELHELRTFRDALRRDAGLRDRYVAAKQRIVDGGERSGQAYAVAKGDFVSDTLLAIGAWPRPADAGPPIEPGATIGILGGGQLGRMLAIAARQLGYGVAILDPDPFCPARAVADHQVEAAYDSVKGARELAAGCAVVTYELEHVSAEAVEAIAGRVPVRPGLAALRATQDRLAERRFVREQGELTANWRPVHGLEELSAAAEDLGYPLRLKAPIGGYDGRSQARIAGPDDVPAALAAVERQEGRARPLLLERELDFEAELSVVCARDLEGRTLAYPVSRNVHDRGILVESVAPAPIDPLHAATAADIAGRLARALDVVGVMTVELFLVGGRDLAVNELAPRVHNSGHWTIEGAPTSQFQQHIRAICGLPLGSVEPRGAAAMVNLLGTGPKRAARLTGLPEALADPSVAVHVYGKRAVFDRRKMGHVTALAADGDAEAALARARTAVGRLGWAE